MNLSRRDVLRAGLVAGIGGGAAAVAWSQAADVTRILVGFPPGGGVDGVARQVAERLEGQPAIRRAVIVENRPGAGGQVAVQAMKAAPADGSAVLLTPMSILGVYPHTYPKLAYHPAQDLTPLSNAVSYDFAFAVGPAVPASVSTVPQFVEWCKAHPGKASFGTAATGSTLHFVGVLLGAAAGVDLTHVGYRGSGAMVVDLASGVLPAACGTVGNMLPYANAGKCRIIGTSGARRSPFTPQVGTFSEQGYKDMVFTEWYGFFLPARAPAELVQRLNATLRKALAAPAIADVFARTGLHATPSSPEELAVLLKADTQRWGEIVRRFGFTAES